MITCLELEEEEELATDGESNIKTCPSVDFHHVISKIAAFPSIPLISAHVMRK